jgi:hypothetical protein
METSQRNTFSVANGRLWLDQGGLADNLGSRSDIDLLGYGKRIVDLDAEIAHRAFDLQMVQ